MYGRISSDTDLTNLVVGDLTVERYLDSHPTAGRRWACMCTCGKPAIRLTSALMSAHRRGKSMACAACTAEMQRGRSIAYFSTRRQALVMYYAEYGSLYGNAWSTNEQAGLVAEIAAEFEGVAPDVSPLALPLRVAPGWNTRGIKNPEKTDYGVAGYGTQDWSTLFPWWQKDKRYHCNECKHARVKGYGCADCSVFVCYDCAAADLHRHGRGKTLTKPRELLESLEKITAVRRAKVNKEANAKGFIGFVLTSTFTPEEEAAINTELSW